MILTEISQKVPGHLSVKKTLVPQLGHTSTWLPADFDSIPTDLLRLNVFTELFLIALSVTIYRTFSRLFTLFVQISLLIKNFPRHYEKNYFIENLGNALNFQSAP